MIRRILVIGSIGLALAGGARFALRELAERAWEKRKQELLERALFQPQERRLWEVRFEALQERMQGSPRMAEITNSSYRPYVAWGSGEPRALNAFEKIWAESAWSELDGLDPVLHDLRALRTEDLEWHGAPARLLPLRECTNALCARAWIALEQHDDEAVARAYADALRLARATDDGTSIAAGVRWTCEGIALRSVRSALALGAGAAELRAEMAPLLADWNYAPERGEHCLRRDLAFLADFHPDAPESGSARAWLEPVEKAFTLAQEPPAKWELAVSSDESPPEGVSRGSWVYWTTGIELLHERHAVRNVVLTALAVAESRAQYGAWPGSLAEIDDLPVEQELDTLTGAPLPYSIEGSGVRVGPASLFARGTTWEGAGEPLHVWTLR
jgi:hypothetical protein